MDCKWNNWSSWSCIDIEFEGCSVGNIVRTRTVAVEANKWGKCVGSSIQFPLFKWCNVKCQCFANIPIPPGIVGETLRRKVTNFMKEIRCPIPPQGNIQTSLLYLQGSLKVWSTGNLQYYNYMYFIDLSTWLGKRVVTGCGSMRWKILRFLRKKT